MPTNCPAASRRCADVATRPGSRSAASAPCRLHFALTPPSPQTRRVAPSETSVKWSASTLRLRSRPVGNKAGRSSLGERVGGAGEKARIGPNRPHSGAEFLALAREGRAGGQSHGYLARRDEHVGTERCWER